MSAGEIRGASGGASGGTAASATLLAHDAVQQATGALVSVLALLTNAHPVIGHAFPYGDPATAAQNTLASSPHLVQAATEALERALRLSDEARTLRARRDNPES